MLCVELCMLPATLWVAPLSVKVWWTVWSACCRFGLKNTHAKRLVSREGGLRKHAHTLPPPHSPPPLPPAFLSTGTCRGAGDTGDTHTQVRVRRLEQTEMLPATAGAPPLRVLVVAPRADERDEKAAVLAECGFEVSVGGGRGGRERFEGRSCAVCPLAPPRRLDDPRSFAPLPAHATRGWAWVGASGGETLGRRVAGRRGGGRARQRFPRGRREKTPRLRLYLAPRAPKISTHAPACRRDKTVYLEHP